MGTSSGKCRVDSSCSDYYIKSRGGAQIGGVGGNMGFGWKSILGLIDGLKNKATIKWLSKFKSPMYYWHTGRKGVAVVSMGLTGAISAMVFLDSTGLSLLGIFLAVFSDAVGVMLAIVYLVFIFPAFGGFFHSQVVEYLVVPAVIGSIMSRVITYFVARRLN